MPDCACQKYFKLNACGPKKRATMDPFLQKKQTCTPQQATALTESTPAERIFSAAVNICSQKRASLTRDHVDMLTFLSMNKLNDIA